MDTLNSPKMAVFIVLVVAVVGGIFYLNSQKVKRDGGTEAVTVIPRASSESNGTTSSLTSPSTEVKKDTMPSKFLSAEVKSKRYELAKEITTPDGFINTDNKPITIGEFVGKKIVLIDFWTYSCINCQRTIPYLNSWWEKYKDKGLVIIGLHTPEFEFEKIYDNVLAAVKKFGIEYPVVLDNDYSTWRAYRNQYWPRKYLIDIDGYIVYDHIGEGGYEETERQIQKALAERMERLNEKGSVDVAITKEAAVPRAGSPEVYFGASRNEYLGNGEQGRTGIQTLVLPESPSLNRLYLGGKWDVQPQYAETQSSSAAVEFRYRAQDVYFVASSEKGVSAKVYLDGMLVKGDGEVNCRLKGYCGGEDVSADGAVFIKEDRLYKLIHHLGTEEHVLKIEVESPGLKAFTFTFG